MAGSNNGIAQWSGINFGQSNLNYYQTGSWTPGLSFGGGTTGITYTTQQGTYTKIGNVVFYSLLLNISSKGSSTGNAAITGFPFTPNGFSAQQTPPIATIGNMSLTANYTHALLDTSGVTGTSIPLIQWGSTVGFTNMTDAIFSNNARIEGNGFYFVV